ncbi:MAG: MBL fold metallo-hydrolase [Candidatus Micrarchaeota archaeon]|nr:MBL fold metallo-hydrolase [Candidatus Micrarchaeota archaeon]
MEIVFLGTGGGRYNMVRQIRKTGGWRLNASLNFHVDPGPGALFSSLEYRQDPKTIDAIVITHNHIDHTNDANLLIEAFAKFGKKNGHLIGSRSVIFGDEKGDRGVSNYHLNMLEKYWVVAPAESLCQKIKGKIFSFFATRVKHEDATGFGFVIEIDGKKIGYTSDTEYFAGIGKQYEKSDLLIINCLKPKDDLIPGHLDTQAACKLLDEARPKKAIITHLGMSMLKAGPDKEAKKIERQTGVETLAAEDGMKVNL